MEEMEWRRGEEGVEEAGNVEEGGGRHRPTAKWRVDFGFESLGMLV